MFLTADLVCHKVCDKSAFDVGSKNPGLANVGLEFGLKPAFIVLIGDAAKVIIPSILLHYLFGAQLSWTCSSLWCGLGATLGHNYPAWHHFTGGEGVMTSSTAMVIATPVVGIASILVGLVSVFVTKYLNLAAVIICMAYTILLYIQGFSEFAFIGLCFSILSWIANFHSIKKIGTDEAEAEQTDLWALITKK